MDRDTTRAIETHQSALIRIVARLMILADLVDGTIPARLERVLHTMIVQVLRPAESAVRRLIILMAQGIAVTLRPARPIPAGLKRYAAKPRKSFQLFDPRPRVRRPREKRRGPGPRITVFLPDGPISPLNRPRPAIPELHVEGLVGAVTLGRRLMALKTALDNLPAQAQRMARWQARRSRMQGVIDRSALRPGRPPGYRRKPKSEIDHILHDCHERASYALKHDSS